MTDTEIKSFIRERLAFPHSVTRSMRHHPDAGMEHFRFDMSGYGSNVTSSNNSLLDKFEDIGIYDYTLFLSLDFYKGGPILILRYFHGGDFRGDADVYEEFHGWGTVEIIFRIIKLTIFSGERTRRR